MAERVSVIGLGNMGSALARAWLNAGYGVTVWNRTSEKADRLVDAGAEMAADAAAALRASPITVACVGRYEHLYDALRQAGSDDFAGKTLVNLTWGTPDDARAMEAWVRERGGDYLDGGIPVYPSGIAQPKTELLFAGPQELWYRHDTTLRALGGASRLVAEPIGAANVVALAIAGNFYHLCYGAFFETVAYAASEGVPVTELRSQITSALALLTGSIEDAVAALVSEEYATDQATLWIQLDAVTMGRDAMRRRGQQATLSSALVDLFSRGVADGRGDLSCAAIMPQLRDGG